MDKSNFSALVGRSAPEELQKHIGYFNSGSVYQELFDRIPELILILNKYRESVFINKKTKELLQVDNPLDIYGKRPGEIFGCLHAEDVDSGCGDALACKYCGAVISIKAAQGGDNNENECLILTKNNLDAYEMRVSSSALELNDESFVVFTLADISDTKRKQLLERIFFHDLMNTATGISTLSHLLNIKLPDEYSKYKQLAGDYSNKLIDEIKSQRQIIAAENGNLSLEIGDTVSCEIISNTANMAMLYNLQDEQLEIDREMEKISFKTDRAILARVLTNLIKNAYEAEYKGGKITVSCSKKDENTICFSVNNPSVMPESIREQVFKRSFSTKGAGRGLGTYSIKLLTEKYLKGKVYFESKEPIGTTFYVELPVDLGS